TAVAPLGSMIYTGTASASIAVAAETDTFTIALDAGQTVSLVATPAAGLKPSLELLAPDGSSLGAATASATGGYAVLQTLPAATAGTYTIAVGGASSTTGAYSIALTLNAAVEAEAWGGTANNTQATGQDLDGTFLSLPGTTGQRGGVAGVLATGNDDWYRFTLADGQSANVALGGTGMAAAAVTLYDATGTALALGVTTGNAAREITNFRDATSDGLPQTYAVRVSGATGAYRLAVTRGIGFDKEPNNTPALAAGLDDGAALGYLDIPQLVQQQKIVSIEGGFGHTVAADGDVAIAGVGYAACVLGRVNGQWVQTQKLTPSDNGTEQVGSGVAIRGNTALVGASGVNAAYVYRFDGTQWNMVQKLQAAGSVGIILAVDGDMILMGSPGDAAGGDNAGAVFAFRFDGTQWNPIQKLTAPVPGAGQYFGTSISLSGHTAVIGARGDNQMVAGGGAAYVFVFDGTQWTFQQKLLPSSPTTGGYFGMSVAIDGGQIVVGSPGSQGGTISGAVDFFGFDGTRWTWESRFASPSGAVDLFGRAVDIRGDFAAAGACLDGTAGSDAGAVYAFLRRDGQWLLVQKLIASDAKTGTDVGWRIAVAGGRTILAGTGNYSGIWAFAQITEDDYYSVRASAGDVVTIDTDTPGGLAGELVNRLDPVVEVYDSAGSLIGRDDNGAADGRNVHWAFTAPAAGTYSVRMTATGDTIGEYVVRASGATAAPVPAAFSVQALSIPDGSRLKAVPTTVTVDLTDLVLASSLQAGDLMVDGLAATGVSLADGDTAIFTLPSLGEGSHTFSLAAGAFVDVQGTPVSATSAGFIIDLTAPRVIASSLLQSAVVPIGAFTYTATFSEPLGTWAWRLSRYFNGQYTTFPYTPAATYDPVTSTITVTCSWLPEGSYTLTLVSSSNGETCSDLAGNLLDGERNLSTTVPSGNGVPGGEFYLNFSADVVSTPWTGTLLPVDPRGSMVYKSDTDWGPSGRWATRTISRWPWTPGRPLRPTSTRARRPFSRRWRSTGLTVRCWAAARPRRPAETGPSWWPGRASPGPITLWWAGPRARPALTPSTWSSTPN
ncbi:MAG: pre-peptidase C-terminal domain-containing protein, partial [Planctomycetota bacterium]|nr:pre-peptidase C-terminal domain-containing protein [Planctomycetota bacterium]